MYGAPENRESDFRGESLMIAARERYQIVLGILCAMARKRCLPRGGRTDAMNRIRRHRSCRTNAAAEFASNASRARNGRLLQRN